MANESKTLGRTELAQLYFPYILPHSAWKKFKSLLEDIPALQHLTTLRRRSSLFVRQQARKVLNETMKQKQSNKRPLNPPNALRTPP